MTEPGAFDQPRASLDEVLCTDELRRRPARPPDYAAENRALAALAEAMAQSPSTILQKLVNTARDLCRADSAGISILEKDGDQETFRWRAVAGQFGVNAGQGIPRDASPCGTVLDRDAALLFTRPERHFAYSVAADVPLAEALLVPFHAGGMPVGTVWVVNHTDDRRFDAEDARLLESLSRFAAAAYRMIGALRDAEVVRDELEERVRRRTIELKESQSRLVAELAAMTRLHELVGRLLICPDVRTALEEILAATVEIAGADMGNVQLFNPHANALELVAHRGFDTGLLDHFRIGTAEDDSACGRALRERRRVVIEDVAADPSCASLRESARAAGYRSVQSTPLTGRGGELLGILSTHYRRPHRPSEWELRILDLYTRQAAEFIDRARAGAALRESEARLQLALSAARMGIWSWDVAADILTRDANFNRLLGLEPFETRQPSREFLGRVHPDDRAMVAWTFDACAKRGRPLSLEFRVIRRDGEICWLRHQGGVSGAPDGGVPRVTGASVDITPLRETEAALRRARAGLEDHVAARASRIAGQATSQAHKSLVEATRTATQLAATALRTAQLASTPPMVRSAAQLAASTARAAERALKLTDAFYSSQFNGLQKGWIEAVWTEVRRALATTEEEERRRIARELHDQLGQHCASLIIGMTALGATLPADAQAQLERLVQLARRIDDDMHRIARELRPTTLDDLGLHDTLQGLAEDWGEWSGVVIDFRSHGPESWRLPREVETAVYRIVQEALTNVQKHAAAGRVGLIVTRREQELVVIVEDDGVGFDPEPVFASKAVSRLGIRGMRERAALVGGNLEVESAPGNGTTLFVRIPLLPDGRATSDA